MRRYGGVWQSRGAQESVGSHGRTSRLCQDSVHVIIRVLTQDYSRPSMSPCVLRVAKPYAARGDRLFPSGSWPLFSSLVYHSANKERWA